VDVITGDLCSVQLLENERLLEVEQKMLETVIPPVGERIAFVSGKNFGKVGKLMDRTKLPNGESTAFVQLLSDLTSDTYPLDSISQYVGDSME